MSKKKTAEDAPAIRQEIASLFHKAKQTYSRDAELAHRLVRKARRLGMKNKIRLSRELQVQFCKHCYHYLMPDKNARVRIKNKVLIVLCRDCKRFTKFVLRKR